MAFVQTPPLHSDAEVLADWWEISALTHEFSEIGLSSLIGRTDSGEARARESEDLGKDADNTSSQIIAEISSRSDALEASYPFSISDNGEILTFDAPTEIGGQLYLLCLGFSHPNSSILLSEPFLEGLIRADPRRLLFESISAIGVAGFIQGNAKILGTSILSDDPDEVDLKKRKIIRFQEMIYNLVGDGTPLGRIPPGVSTMTKDAGIDIIAWKKTNRGDPPHAQYIIAQVASGENWKTKSAKSAEKEWHKAWFNPSPITPANCLTAMPFCFVPDIPTEPMYSREENVKAYRGLMLERHGQVLSRKLLPHYAKLGQELHAQGGFEIDGIDRIPELETWSREFIAQAKTRAAA